MSLITVCVCFEIDQSIGPRQIRQVGQVGQVGQVRQVVIVVMVPSLVDITQLLFTARGGNTSLMTR